MVKLTLPDKSIREFPNAVTGLALAEDISKSLAKKVVLIDVDGELWDLTRPIEQDATVRLVTRDEPEGVEVIRHDTAHVLAEAVQELFPGTQVTIGPNIENGFFYDFAREEPFSTDDFEKIEKRMAEIVDRDEAITREVWDRNEAIDHFKSIGEAYKAEIISDLPESEEITVYRQGNWKDLCRGPHLPSTGRVGKAFKLTKLAGAYWRGDSNNAQLQRIYGTAWANEKDLKRHLTMLEEAEKRDHRKLGREMNLFHFQEEGPGSIFWHPHGWRMFQTLIDYMRDQQNKAGYEEINTPDVMDKSLWEKSGHWEKFGENMYTSVTPDDRTFCLKPMNCPGHVQVFKHGLRSYRELPLKFAEFGKCHRYEPSGALHGMMRVRHFTQDDAHIFCTDEQITDECVTVTNLILSIYRDFGFEDVRLKFSDRPEKRVGLDEVWDKAEASLKTAIEATGLKYELNEGEGAFYGPKIEFVLRDAIGRDWQCGTVQLDFNLPGRLGSFYIGEDGDKHVPVMIHRALFGSLERFLGILIEHHAGRFPLWLAPLQCVVATITSDADGYGREVIDVLKRHGLNVESDFRNEKINYKVREHSLAKVPALLVVGQREEEERTVAIRRLGSKAQTILPLEEAARLLAEEALPPHAAKVAAAAE